MTDLHLQNLLQALHDDQCGFLHCRVTVLSAVLHYLHQSLVSRAAQVVLVSVRPDGQTHRHSQLRFVIIYSLHSLSKALNTQLLNQNKQNSIAMSPPPVLQPF